MHECQNHWLDCKTHIYSLSNHPRFGGYIIPRGPTSGSGRGTPGLLLKALALAGHGGKGFSWFEFGPEETFPGNCWSEVALLEKNHSMFAYIAEASRMISAAEPLLWPAAPARPHGPGPPRALKRPQRFP